MNHFADNLKYIRQELGWSREYIAGKLSSATGKDIDSRRVQNWELDRGEPEYDILKEIILLFLIDDMFVFMYKPLTSLPLTTRILHAGITV